MNAGGSFPWPRPNDRAIFVGPTSSGKTTLARQMLQHYRNVIVVDPKHRFSWDLDGPRWRRTAHDLPQLVAQLREVETGRTGEPVVYRPPREHLLPRNAASLDEVARIALERGGTLLFYDELYYVASGSNFTERAPNWYYCVTTGRERGVGVWSAFQRPAHIPLAATSESDYRFVFFLRKEEDRKRAEDLCGAVPWDTLKTHKHSFVWADDAETSEPARLKV